MRRKTILASAAALAACLSFAPAAMASDPSGYFDIGRDTHITINFGDPTTNAERPLPKGDVLIEAIPLATYTDVTVGSCDEGDHQCALSTAVMEPVAGFDPALVYKAMPDGMRTTAKPDPSNPLQAVFDNLNKGLLPLVSDADMSAFADALSKSDGLPPAAQIIDTSADDAFTLSEGVYLIRTAPGSKRAIAPAVRATPVGAADGSEASVWDSGFPLIATGANDSSTTAPVDPTKPDNPVTPDNPDKGTTKPADAAKKPVTDKSKPSTAPASAVKPTPVAAKQPEAQLATTGAEIGAVVTPAVVLAGAGIALAAVKRHRAKSQKS